jgi:lysophospholipase L1-like esterase
MFGQERRHHEQTIGRAGRRSPVRSRWVVVAAIAGAAVTTLAPSPRLAAATPLPAAPAAALTEDAPLAPAADPMAGSGWLATWSAAPVPPRQSGRSADGFGDQTIRQIVHTSVGGGQLRIQLSNTYGTRPVRVDGATVALRSRGAALVPGTDRGLSVAGSRTFTLPVGATVVTDPVALTVLAGSDLAVSLFLGAPTGPATSHPLALTTNYLASGDHVADDVATAFGSTTSSWWFLSGVDVEAPADAHAVVAFGASTTDGQGSTANGDNRWVDDLNRRLRTSGSTTAVVDQGISGNELLSSGTTGGPSGVERFAADALSQPGVSVVVVSSLGNDDIGHRGDAATAAALIAGYQHIIGEAQAHGVRVIGATLTPDRGAGLWTAAGEKVREQVNTWILTSHAFDATVDLARVLANPHDPTRLAAAYDSGDHLHPNPAGYRAEATAIAPAILAATTTAM